MKNAALLNELFPKQTDFLKSLIIFLSIFLAACGGYGQLSTDNFYITELSASGTSGLETKLIITLNEHIPNLTAGDIKINTNIPVIKRDFNITDNPLIYELDIIPGQSGLIRVGLDPYSGFIGWNAKTANVHAIIGFNGVSELTITSYAKTGGTVLIPSHIAGLPVTSIGNSAFANRLLSGITIPDSVTTIENNAFARNKLENAESIEISENVISIGIGAFAYNQLTGINIPDGVVFLAGFNNNDLASVTIPSSVTTIGVNAFSYNMLTAITIPEAVTTIGNNAFSYNKLTNVTIPDTVTSIGNDIFSNNRLISAAISENVTIIGNSAFANNELTGVTIPAKVSTIGSEAFAFNLINNIIFSGNVLVIGAGAFRNNELVSVTIPESVHTIGDRAFRYNKLTEIIIPKSVKTIGDEAFRNNPLLEIRIGEKVNLNAASFGNGFEKAYEINERAAGRYYRININSTEWGFEMEPAVEPQP